VGETEYFNYVGCSEKEADYELVGHQSIFIGQIICPNSYCIKQIQ
jgi:hypothetical protein